jgi:RHS repeat-associated protein
MKNHLGNIRVTYCTNVTANTANNYYSFEEVKNRHNKGNTDVYYFNGPDGKTEVVNWAASGKNYTYNIWGTDNIGQVRVTSSSTNRYYYLKDHLGSIKVTVNGGGSVVGYDDYCPFGMTMSGRSSTGSADARYKFTSKERDFGETGWDYFGARYYDSRIGRWLQVDPLAGKYPNLSPYDYVADNPLRFIDSTGREIG